MGANSITPIPKSSSTDSTQHDRRQTGAQTAGSNFSLPYESNINFLGNLTMGTEKIQQAQSTGNNNTITSNINNSDADSTRYSNLNANNSANPSNTPYSNALKTQHKENSEALNQADKHIYTIFLNNAVKPEEQCNIYICNEINRCKPNLKEDDIVARFVSNKRVSIRCRDNNISTYIMENWPADAFSKFGGLDRVEPYDGTTRWLLAFVNHIMTVQEEEWIKEKYNISTIEKLGAKEYKLICGDSTNYNNILEAGHIKAGYAIIKIKTWNSRPVIERCYYCQKWGHVAAQCPRDKKLGPICKYCSMNHDSRGCKREEIPEWHLCINCGGNHKASTTKCPKHIELVEKITNKNKNTKTNTDSKRYIKENCIEQKKEVRFKEGEQEDYNKKLEEYKKKIDSRIVKAVVMCSEINKSKVRCPNVEKLTDDLLNTSLGEEMTTLKKQLNPL